MSDKPDEYKHADGSKMPDAIVHAMHALEIIKWDLMRDNDKLTELVLSGKLNHLPSGMGFLVSKIISMATTFGCPSDTLEDLIALGKKADAESQRLAYTALLNQNDTKH